VVGPLGKEREREKKDAARKKIGKRKEIRKEKVGPTGDTLLHVNRGHGYVWKSRFAGKLAHDRSCGCFPCIFFVASVTVRVGPFETGDLSLHLASPSIDAYKFITTK
jgi:hypothetical protein